MTDFEDSVLLVDAESPQTPEVKAVVVPDRAEAPVSEITERFLRAVIAKIPLERIEELHLFAPLRQGGTETGIAVIAARVPVAPERPSAMQGELSSVALPDNEVEVVVDSVVDDEAHVDDDTDIDDETDVDGETDIDDGTDVDGGMDVDDGMDIDERVESNIEEELDVDAEDVSIPADTMEDSPYLNSTEAAGDLLEVLAGEGFDDEVVDEVADPVAAVPLVRHTVYTARYRLVLKGPERGTWEADVVNEADAPLVTVEMVVRGVQRRAGEETEILRYSDRQIARALRMEWPLPAT